MPTTPRLKIEALVDFILKAKSVNNSDIVKAVQSSMKDVKVQELDVSPVLKLDDEALKQGAVRQIDQTLDALSKRIAETPEALRKAYEAQAKKLGVTVNQDLLKRVQTQTVDQLKTAESAYRSFAGQVDQILNTQFKGIGEGAAKAVRTTMEQLRTGRVLITDLDKETVKSVREATGILEQRGRQISKLAQTASKLETDVFGVEPRIGQPTIAGVPAPTTLLPGIDKQLKQVNELTEGVRDALDPSRPKTYQETLNGLNDSLKRTSQSWAGLNRQVKKLEDTDVFEGTKEGLDKLKEEARAIRGDIKKISKLEDFDKRKARTVELSDRAYRLERKAAIYRLDLEDQVAKKRSVALGTHVKNLEAISRIPIAQAEAEAGRKLLKGAPAEQKLVVKGIETPEAGASVIEALKQQVREGATALRDYARAAGDSFSATDKGFTDLRDKLFTSTELLNQAQQKVSALTREGAIQEGRRPAAVSKAEKTIQQQLEGTRTLLGTLEQVNAELAKTGARGAGVDQLGNTYRRLTDQLTKAGEAASLASVMGDEKERDKALRGNRKLLKEAEKDFQKYAKTAQQEMSRAYGIRREDLRQARVTAGEARIAQVGAPGGVVPYGAILQSTRDFAEVNNVAAAVNERLAQAKTQLREFEQSTKGAVSTDRWKELSGEVGNLTTQFDRARERSADLYAYDWQKRSTEDTARLTAEAVKSNNAFGKMQGIFQDIGGSLTQLTKRTKDWVGTRKGLDDFEGGLERVKEGLADVETRAAAAMLETDLKERQRLLADVHKDAVETQKDLEKLDKQRAKHEHDYQRDLERREAEPERIRRGEEEAVRRERAERGEEVLAEAKRGYRKDLGIPPLLFAAQRVDLSNQMEAMESFYARRIGAEQELAKLQQSRAAAGTKRAAAELAQQEKIHKKLEDISAAEAELQKRQRELQELGVKPEVEAQERIGGSQKAALRRVYGVDPDYIIGIKKGAVELERALGAEIKKVQAEMAKMPKATAHYKTLAERLATLDNRLREVKVGARQLNQEFDKASALARGDVAGQYLASRYFQGKQAVKEAGGAAAIARTGAAIPKQYREDLGVVKDYLGIELAKKRQEGLALLDKGYARTSAEYAKASTEANTLEKAIKKVNVQARGYLTLAGQMGALFRQFARYGIGYAALYQALYGMRALVAGVVELDSALISIKAITQSTNREMEIIGGTIKRVALVTKFTTGEIAGAGQVLAQAGVLAKDFPEALSAVAYFASATESSMQVSADLLSTMRNVFKGFSDLTLANQLTQAVNISKLTAEDLKTILSLSSQMAASYKLTSDQYLSAVATMRNAGIKASTTATGLRQALIEIFSPDSKTIKVLSKRYAALGETLNEEQIRQRFFQFSLDTDPLLGVMRELRRLGFTGAAKATFSGRTFDVRAENAVNAIIGNLDEYVASQAKLVFGNAAIDASVTQMESLSNSAKNLGAALTATSHSLTEDFLPAVEDFIDNLTSFVEGVAEFDLRLRATTGAGAAAVGGIGGAIGLYGATRRIPENMTLPMRIARGAGIAGAGVYGGYLGADFASDLRLDEGQTKVATAASAGLGVALALFAEKVIVALSNFFSGAANQWGPKVAGLVTKLPGFGTILGGLLTIVSVVYWLWPRDRIKQMQNRLRDARAQHERARSELKKIDDQLNQFRKSTKLVRADEKTIAGTAEKLRKGMSLLNDQIVQFFGLSGESVGNQIDQIKEVLVEMDRTANEEGTKARQRAVESLDALVARLGGARQVFGDEDAESQLVALQNAQADIHDLSRGLFEEIVRNYERWTEEGARFGDDVTATLAQSLHTAVSNLDMERKLAGLVDTTSEEIVNLFEAWLEQIGLFKDQIEERRRAVQQEEQTYELRVDTLIESVTKAPSAEEARRVIRREVRVPQTQEAFNRMGEAVNELIQYQFDEHLGWWEKAVNLTRLEQVKIEEARRKANARAAQEEVEAISRAALVQDKKRRDEVVDSARARVLTYAQALELAPEIPELARQLDLLRGRDLTEKDFNALSEAQRNTIHNFRVFEERYAVSGGDARKAADELVDTEREPGAQLGTYGLFPSADAMLHAVESAYEQNVSKLPKIEVEYPQDRFDVQTEASIRQIDLEIEDLTEAGKDASFLINTRKELIVESLNRQLDHLREQQEIANKGRATDEEQLAIEREILRVEHELLETERGVVKQIESLTEEGLDREKSTLETRLDLLAAQADEMLSAPFFADFSGLEELNEKYKATLNGLIENIEERQRLGIITNEEAENEILALQQAGLSIYEFADAFDKARRLTEAYIEAMTTLTSTRVTRTLGDALEQVRRRERGIREPWQDRLSSIQEEAALRTEDLSSLTAQLKPIFEKLETDIPEKERRRLELVAASIVEDTDTIKNRLVELRELTRGITLDIKGELAQAFDITGIMSDFRQIVEENIGRLGEDIRNEFSDLFRDLSGTMVDALFGDLEEGVSPRDALKQLAKDFVKDIAKRLSEAAIQKGLYSTLSLIFPQYEKLLGTSNPLGAREIKAGVVNVKAGIVNVKGAGIPGLDGKGGAAGGVLSGILGTGAEEKVPLGSSPGVAAPETSILDAANIGKDVVTAADKIGDAAKDVSRIEGLPSIQAEVPAGEGGLFGGLMKGLKTLFSGVETVFSGLFSGVTSTFEGIFSIFSNGAKGLLSGLSSFGSTLAGLFKGLGGMFSGGTGGGGGGLFSFIPGIVGLFTGGGGLFAKKGAVIGEDKFSRGGMIRGPGTGTSDSIPGVVVDERGIPERRIAVSNGEAIVNKKAVDQVGTNFIHDLNAGRVPFKEGGVIASDMEVPGAEYSMKEEPATSPVVVNLGAGSSKLKEQEEETPEAFAQGGMIGPDQKVPGIIGPDQKEPEVEGFAAGGLVTYDEAVKAPGAGYIMEDAEPAGSVVVNLGAGSPMRKQQEGEAEGFARGGMIGPDQKVPAINGPDQEVEGFASGGVVAGLGMTYDDALEQGILLIDEKGRPVSPARTSRRTPVSQKTLSFINKSAGEFATRGIAGKTQVVDKSLSEITHAAAPRDTSIDISGLAESLVDIFQSSAPQNLALQVEETALERTLGDYLEGYFADVIAVR